MRRVDSDQWVFPVDVFPLSSADVLPLALKERYS